MKLVAILSDIRSIHNVGSVFRTADAAGFEKIYCSGITPAPIDRFKNVRADFAKVSLGAEKSMAWETAKDPLPLIKTFKKEGWNIFAVEQSKNSIPYFQAFPRGKFSSDAKIALVVGNEVDGLPPAIMELADKILEIPMRGKKESLNVSVVFGVVAFDITSQEHR